jgi:hypothetical protein
VRGLHLSQRRFFVRNRPMRGFAALQVHVLIDVYAWHRSYLQARACGDILHSPTTEPGRQGLEAVTRVAASNPLIFSSISRSGTPTTLQST